MITTNYTKQLDHSRFRWISLVETEKLIDTGEEVIQGLESTPKILPCRYFYDDRGSQLFEQICDTPEYYPTRAEQSILETYAAEIVTLTGASELIELGSGSSRKTRLLLEAYSQLDQPLHYYPIDVSAGILKSTALELLAQYPTLRLYGLAGTYEQALADLPSPALENRMLIFLGSTLGNLDKHTRDRFLTQIQQALKPGEFFLLGIDLQKSIEVIEAAYNDTQGITAAFNLNILQHLNERFLGNFDLAQFQHLAFYNSVEHRIEMHLKSLTTQTIDLKALNYQVRLEAGETIRTELSHKFHLPTLAIELEHHALKPLQIWTDPQGLVGLLLCQRQCTTSDCP
jgi:L-histidine N-alpha-methyltransferase